MKSKPDEDRGFLYEIMCIFSLAAAIDDIQEEEESHYLDRLREYNLYADSIRYTCNIFPCMLAAKAMLTMSNASRYCQSAV